MYIIPLQYKLKVFSYFKEIQLSEQGYLCIQLDLPISKGFGSSYGKHHLITYENIEISR